MQIHLKQLAYVASICAALVTTGLTTGCHTEGRSAGTYIDDRLVSSKVKGALNDSPIYKYPNVDVSTFNGTVQLNGFVESAAQKDQAAQVASQVQGVKQLVNNITIQAAPTGHPTGYPTPPPPAPVAPPQPR